MKPTYELGCVKLSRPYEHAILAVSNVLQNEIDHSLSKEQFIREVMIQSKGKINPSIVTEIVNRIFEERY